MKTPPILALIAATAVSTAMGGDYDPVASPVPTMDDMGASRRITPAQFHALTVPADLWRVNIQTEYYTENYSYDEEDDFGRVHWFDADDYFEETTTLTVKRGITDFWDVGVEIPLVYSEFQRASSDRSSSYPHSANEWGLGNVRLTTGIGTSWNHESDYLLLDLAIGLPTDTRDNDLFSTGGDARAILTYEHYWDVFGVVASGYGEYYADNDFSGGEWEWGGQAGIAIQATDDIYATVVADVQEDKTAIEGFVEFVVGSRSSIEIFGGIDVDGDDDAKYVGIGFNILFGK
ncbi:MAG: hypothetical protein R3F11_02430 [Verrucomicrobiales bacterium]